MRVACLERATSEPLGQKNLANQDIHHHYLLRNKKRPVFRKRHEWSRAQKKKRRAESKRSVGINLLTFSRAVDTPAHLSSKIMKLSIVLFYVFGHAVWAKESIEERRNALRSGKRGLQGGDGGDSGSGGDDGGNVCFSGHNTVEVQGKGLVSMTNVEIGDFVRSGNDDFSRVIGFSKFDHEAEGEYLQLTAQDLKAPLELSASHMVFVSGKAVAASDVKVGDMVGENEVIDIKQVLRRGAYAPITEAGDIVVSGVLASCYVTILDYCFFSQHAVFHAFMAPFRLGLIPSWSYGENRAAFFRHGAYFFASLKPHYSAPAQYLISLVAIPIFAMSMFEFFFKHFWLVAYLAVAGMLGYYKSIKSNSKVKTL